MLFHYLDEEMPNIVNLKIDVDDCTTIDISNDGKYVAVGKESGKIYIFEFFETFGPSS